PHAQAENRRGNQGIGGNKGGGVEHWGNSFLLPATPEGAFRGGHGLYIPKSIPQPSGINFGKTKFFSQGK
ncbi:MAG: hypothetical protein SOZ90_02825, partial [Candidatus Faecousia sp.]|nr:hypothetical protein [Candidatus Faecousia sp.]